MSSIVNSPKNSPLYLPTLTGDDRADIQRALDAAEATSGTVLLSARTWNITTQHSPATADRAAGAYGIEIPSNVTLAGCGPGTVLNIISGGNFGVGCGISPKGMRDCTTNFGAASNVMLRDFTIRAAADAESSGNLINLVHASDWLIKRVHIAGSYFHGLEVDQSRRVVLVECTFSGAHSFGASGSWMQFDLGAAGPANRPASITTQDVEDCKFIRCKCLRRPDTDSSPRDIDLTHSSTLTLRGIKFRDCYFEGRNVAFTAIAGIDATTATIDSLAFEGCTFVTSHPKAYGIYFANTSSIVNELDISGCEFRGPSASMLTLGGDTTINYNATHAQRKFLSVRDNTFVYDKTQMVASYELSYISITAWTHAEFTGNKIRGVGDFPVSVGQSYSRLSRAVNCLSTVWDDNKYYWEGNNTFAVGRDMAIITTIEADNAGLTLGLRACGNRLYSTAGTGWSNGLSLAFGATIPSGRALAFEDNASNVAISAQFNVTCSGAQSAGAQSSGALAFAVRAVTANTTATRQDGVIRADATAGNITITLPAVNLRCAFRVVKVGATNSVIVGGVTLTADGSIADVYSDGTTNFATQIA